MALRNMTVDGKSADLYDEEYDGACSSACWPVATLASTRLSYVLARYNGLGGHCAAFYGVSDGPVAADAVYAMRVSRR